MCRPAPCKTCRKTTWSGCGQHVAAVRAMVPASNWCAGHPDTPRSTGFLGRLLGR